MSVRVAAETCVALGATQRELQAFPSRRTALGDLEIWRALPVREKRLIGPWCFLDSYGPHTFAEGKPMDVAPHPHIGLQTVSWLLQGEIIHNDSLDCEGLMRPGEVNVMTSGAGIAHSEETPAPNSGTLQGVQLWVALPDQHRYVRPSFQHLRELPVVEYHGGLARVFMGAMDGQNSGARAYSPILGADLEVHAAKEMAVPLDPAFEHALFLLRGDCSIEGHTLEPATLYYLGRSRGDAALRSREGARVLLVGGPPFPETILMWWNFVARTPEEVAEARLDWQEGRRFGPVRAYRGPRLAAPPLAHLARPNPAS